MRRNRLLVAVVILCMVFVTACQGKKEEKNAPQPKETASASSSQPAAEASSDPLKEKIQIKWMIPTQQETTVGESVVIQTIKEKFNVEFEFVETPPGEQYDEKKKLAISTQDIPDIMTWVTKDEANRYGPEGAFKEITPLLDKLPSFKQRLDSDPNGKYNAYTSDEKIWRLPDFNVVALPIFDFGYVKSEFEAVGFAEPKTWDELYEALKKLKEKYPDSYPFAARGKETGLNNVRFLFEMSFTEGKSGPMSFTDQQAAYDPSSNQWIYGPTAPGFRESVEYLAKLYREKLMDPEYLLMDMNTLQDKLKNKKAFLITDYVGGLSGIGDLNPNGILFPLTTPQAADKQQVLGFKGAQVGTMGTVINSKLEGDKLDRVLMVLDYLYSEEGYNLLYWNPDVTTEKDGTKLYNDAMYNGDKPTRDKYLPWSLNASFLVNYETVTKPGTPYADYKRNVLMADANQSKYVPLPTLPFTLEQTEKITKLQTAVNDYWNANIDQFIIGKKDFSKWDAFIQELRAKGADEIVAVYNEVYAQYFKK